MRGRPQLQGEPAAPRPPCSPGSAARAVTSAYREAGGRPGGSTAGQAAPEEGGARARRRIPLARRAPRQPPPRALPRPLGARPSERPGAAHRQESSRPFRSLRPRPLRAALSSHGRGPAAAGARATPAPDSLEPSPQGPGRGRKKPPQPGNVSAARAGAGTPKYRETLRAACERSAQARSELTRLVRSSSPAKMGEGLRLGSVGFGGSAP